MDDRESADGNEAMRRSRGIALGGIFAGGIALLSATACCVLPLVFLSLGIGATALSFLVPFHWPLTIAAGVAIAMGWYFHLSGRSRPDRASSTMALLALAALFLVLAVAWKPLLEAPLREWLLS